LIKVIDKKRSYTKNQDTPRRKFTREYYLPVENGKDEKVCKNFFKKLFLLSDGRISRFIKSKMVSNTPPRDKRGKHTPFNKTDNLKIAEIKEFINKFPSYESHYSRIKNLNRKYLSPNLNLKMMYNLYKNDSSSPVSFYIFQEVFNKQFNLHFHDPISDSCKKCDTFNMKLKLSKIEDYTGMLDLLYSNGHTITEAKKKDLLDLFALIPPIKHQFYNNLKVDKNHDEDYPDPNEDEHSV